MDSMKLYEYTEDFQMLLNYMEENDLSYEDMKDTIDAIKLPAEEKIKNTGKIIRKKSDDITILKENKKRIDEMIKREERDIENLKNYLLFHMNQLNINKVKDAHIQVATRKSKSMVITNQDKLPKEFLKEKHEITPDKAGFKKYYSSLTPEEQQKIDYAYLAENETILVK